ncbi:hypothetical protein SEA_MARCOLIUSPRIME_49 [Mycobacterium phage Marcoliusprime]|uniref:Uncharacterized protein n=1 Tax=Mycobacterium phage Findley TaxID=2015882 RepID=A0A222ZQV5_9CAUD|nr:hypothetical protein I5G77_gp49 [Mycobacterium phage Findley]AOZ64386.1 hypothetical protein SEA_MARCOLIUSPRIME_49 [Mycobacterium phage Marcoliusprime]ASR86592.1 hypothetical protein SEA_DISMALFUNK_49 [Mycobacterium phage DismalFunk]ASR86789.1 hypothetical protein SEA_FINDLEY_49 [Mycobacterium phage Findley]AYB69003.1 hypothetical protein SEA_DISMALSTRESSOR_49 [Mycobacterium phage DismalStressor]
MQLMRHIEECRRLQSQIDELTAELRVVTDERDAALRERDELADRLGVIEADQAWGRYRGRNYHDSHGDMDRCG